MTNRMPRLLEVVRALSVVALVFLNFGHAPLAAGPGLSSWASSFCGDPVDAPDAGSDLAECPVCLIAAGLDLPPVPATLPRRFDAEPIRHGADDSSGSSPCRHARARPRAPPVS